jgi:chromosomal replication initiation ATPase DnaA
LDKFGNAINNEQRQLNKYKQILVHPINDDKSIRLNQNKPIIDQVYSHPIHDDQMRKMREQRLTTIKETNNYRYSNSIQNHVHSQQQTTPKLATTDQSPINANRSTTSLGSRSNTARSSHHQRFVTAIDLIETKQLIFDNLSESTQCYYIPSASINENRNEVVIGTDRNHNIERRTILLMGESGSGKSALLNSIANYVYGVKINDGYRIRLTESTTTTVGNGATR